jgi:hypothetical protein
VCECDVEIDGERDTDRDGVCVADRCVGRAHPRASLGVVLEPVGEPAHASLALERGDREVQLRAGEPEHCRERLDRRAFAH